MANLGSIGVDIGGTKTLFALFDDQFKIVEEIKIKTLNSKNAKEFKDVLEESLSALAKSAAKAQLPVRNIGIGCAAPLNHHATVEWAPNIPFLKKFPLRNVVRKVIPADVVLINDVDAGLYGEHQFGAAVGLNHVIGIFIGTGVGGALIINGKLYRGATGQAGDIGHYLLQPIGPLAGSDRHGVLDDVVSRTAIAAEAAALALKRSAPNLLKAAGTDLKNIGSSVLAEAIEKGDKEVEELVRSRSQMLGIVLSNIIDFLNPEMLVLGGGLTEAMPEMVRSEVEAGIRAHSTAGALVGLQVVVSKLKGHAVTTGAAKLAVDLAA
jgi:glucokinase